MSATTANTSQLIEPTRREILYYKTLFLKQLARTNSNIEKLKMIEDIRKRYDNIDTAILAMDEILNENSELLKQKTAKESVDLNQSEKTKRDKENNEEAIFTNRRLNWGTACKLKLLRQYFALQNETLLISIIEGLLGDFTRKQAFQDLERGVVYHCHGLSIAISNRIVLLGFCYENGVGVTQDYKVAVEYYTNAMNLCSSDYSFVSTSSAQSSASAHTGAVTAGSTVAVGTAGSAATVVAGSATLPTAIRSNALALAFLAECYERGRYVKRDEKRAIELYQLSASQNCFFAQIQLAVLYLADKRKREALILLEAAAAQKVLVAMEEILDINDTKENSDRAVALYREVAERDDEAKLFLSSRYRFKGWWRDSDKLLREAAAAGNMNAAYDLSAEMLEENPPDPKRINEGILLYFRTAQQGFFEAMMAMRCFSFKFKKEIEENTMQTMIMSLQQDAHRRDPIACYNLAYCYEYGFGISQKLDKGTMDLYHYSATEGCYAAQLKLADFYERGIFYKRNLFLAHFWYQKVYANPYADMDRRNIGMNRNDFKYKIEKIEVLYRKAVENLQPILTNYDITPAQALSEIIAEYSFNEESYLRTQNVKMFFFAYRREMIRKMDIEAMIEPDEMIGMEEITRHVTNDEEEFRQVSGLIADYAESNDEEVSNEIEGDDTLNLTNRGSVASAAAACAAVASEIASPMTIAYAAAARPPAVATTSAATTTASTTTTTLAAATFT